MSEVITVGEEDVRFRKDYRLLRCPKCGKWNRAGYNRPIDKVFIVTCRGCGTKYRPL